MGDAGRCGGSQAQTFFDQRVDVREGKPVFERGKTEGRAIGGTKDSVEFGVCMSLYMWVEDEL
jgi:hypothetical protein